MESKLFRNKKTGEIVTQFSILEINNFEPVEEIKFVCPVCDKIVYGTCRECDELVANLK